jgi:uncharacterized protein (TIGR03067 family)
VNVIPFLVFFKSMFEALVILGLIAVAGIVAAVYDAIKNQDDDSVAAFGEQPGDKIQSLFALDDIQGEWKMVSVGKNGNFAPSMVMQNSDLRMVIDGERYSVNGSAGKIVLRSEGTSTIMDQLDDNGDTHLCIVRLRNDELEICQGEVGDSRPVDFNPERSDDASLTRFARI